MKYRKGWWFLLGGGECGQENDVIHSWEPLSLPENRAKKRQKMLGNAELRLLL